MFKKLFGKKRDDPQLGFTAGNAKPEIQNMRDGELLITTSLNNVKLPPAWEQTKNGNVSGSIGASELTKYAMPTIILHGTEAGYETITQGKLAGVGGIEASVYPALIWGNEIQGIYSFNEAVRQTTNPDFVPNTAMLYAVAVQLWEEPGRQERYVGFADLMTSGAAAFIRLLAEKSATKLIYLKQRSGRYASIVNPDPNILHKHALYVGLTISTLIDAVAGITGVKGQLWTEEEYRANLAQFMGKHPTKEAMYQAIVEHARNEPLP